MLHTAQRFENFVERIPESTCHWWTGALYGKRSRGCFSYGGKLVGAHRVAYMLYVGIIPDGMQVLHTCDNGMCVNPAHLWLGTNQDNVNDAINKGRRKYRSKLLDSEVNSIRGRSKVESAQSLAKEYGVHITSVCNIISNKTWDRRES